MSPMRLWIVSERLSHRRHVMPAERFRSAQRTHFILNVALPSCLALLGLGVPIVREHWQLGMLLWAVFWTLVGGFGVSVGLHRLFSHRAFRATPPLRKGLAILGCMAAQGPVAYWVALHRMHHTYSDMPGDPHSPREVASGGSTSFASFLRGHVLWTWSHDVPSPARFSRDVQADPVLRSVDRHYWLCVAMGYVLPASISGVLLGSASGMLVGLYWGGILRVALGHQIIWSINSWCHSSESKGELTNDNSRNVAAISLVSFGESWHNSHHADAASVRFGEGASQPDLGYAFVRILARLNLAHSLRERKLQPS